jgi:hypothetical protein
MVTVVLSAFHVANFLEGGGHFWVYMQYAQGLRQLGCDVYWLENFFSSGDEERDACVLSAFMERVAQYGLAGKSVVHVSRRDKNAPCGPSQYVGMTQAEAEAVFRRADLLLNFYYRIPPALLSYFRRTALVDIDPGLLQFWISRGQISVHPHDRYFTTGETVGTPAALFPNCGLPWIPIQPPVCLELWPYAYAPHSEAFTTVSNWSQNDWIVDGEEIYENTKRVSFLEFMELPRRTRQVLELALFLTEDDEGERRLLESYGWRISDSRRVASTPEMYQAYVQGSRGEFSCARPSCMRFQNAWVSDRTLCYLASGKPAVVQHTGPSSFLPNGEGMFRFPTIQEAVEAFALINADYERHCRTARAIAETYFDAKKVLENLLNAALKH